MIIYVKVQKEDGFEIERLEDYCKRIARKNNASLYHLETYLGKKLSEDETLAKIRNVILDTSGDISRIPEFIIVGDDHEGL